MRFTNVYYDDLSLARDVGGVDALRSCRILITGATGLIGSCLADTLLLLNADYGFGMSLHLAGRSGKRIAERFSDWDNSFIYQQYDALGPLSDYPAFDFIIHCAGNAHPGAYSTYPVETAMTCISGVHGLLEHVRKTMAGRFLFVSSSEVYGRKKGVRYFKESDYSLIDPLNSRSCYPCSKKAAENLCAAYCSEYGLDCVVVRPGHVFGPTITDYDTRAHAQFTRAALRGEPIVMKSEGGQFRSYCYVVDCVTAILSILMSGSCGEAYNIANMDSDATVLELAEEVASAAGVPIVRAEPTHDEQRGYNLMECSALDASKLRSIGWRGRFNLATGVAHTLKAISSDSGSNGTPKG